MSAAPVPRKIFTVAQRAELRPWGLFRRLRGGDAGLHAHDPPAALYYGRGHIDRCLDFVLAAAELATRSRGRAVCRSHSATACGAAPNSRTVAGMQ